MLIFLLGQMVLTGMIMAQVGGRQDVAIEAGAEIICLGTRMEETVLACLGAVTTIEAATGINRGVTVAVVETALICLGITQVCHGAIIIAAMVITLICPGTTQACRGAIIIAAMVITLICLGIIQACRGAVIIAVMVVTLICLGITQACRGAIIITAAEATA